VEIDEPDFEAMVLAAIEALPQAFRDQLGSVAIVVADEPTPEELASVGAWGLLGLYTGVPRTAYGAENAAMPSKITIYRNSHLRQFGSSDALARGVSATVHHEIAHHFGISDARLEEFVRGRSG
jgi:predicted Zn-dependent protease with MMP-like domain